MFYVYLLASGRNGTLYMGHTDNLLNRLSQHRDGTYRGFTSRYGVKTLVWYEVHESREEAFRRERQIKTWNRLWKIELIESGISGGATSRLNSKGWDAAHTGSPLPRG